jgi:hypothetical protein
MPKPKAFAIFNASSQAPSQAPSQASNKTLAQKAARPWPAMAGLALMALILAAGLFSACAGHSKIEEFKLDVTLGKTTPGDLVRLMGPPIERSASSIDRPLERLHFNVPYNRIIHVQIADPKGPSSQKLIRGKNVISFYFADGLLSWVE